MNLYRIASSILTVTQLTYSMHNTISWYRYSSIKMSSEYVEDDVTDASKRLSRTQISTETTLVAKRQTDPSDLLLDRLHHNVTLFPKKRAMAFIAPSSNNTIKSATNINIEHEVTYAELESETNRLAKSLLEEHRIQRGHRYVQIE
jgi:hypothetical protein